MPLCGGSRVVSTVRGRIFLLQAPIYRQEREKVGQDRASLTYRVTVYVPGNSKAVGAVFGLTPSPRQEAAAAQHRAQTRRTAVSAVQ